MSNAYSTIRGWIQWNAINGSSVIWGSEDRLKFSRDFTVKDFEDIAKEIETFHSKEVEILKAEKQQKQICIDNLKNQLKEMENAFYQIHDVREADALDDLLEIQKIIEPFVKIKES